MGFFDRLKDGLSKTRSQISAIVKNNAFFFIFYSNYIKIMYFCSPI